MATMIPPEPEAYIEEADDRHGELDVYHALREIPGPDWHVYGWSPLPPDPDRRGHPDEEVDFVVARPGLGFLVVEVKGGTVRQADRRWHSWRGAGPVREMRRDPFSQACDLKHGILRWMKRRLGGGYGPIACAHAVVLPHTPATEVVPADSGWAPILCGEEHMDGLGARLQGILETAVRGSGARFDGEAFAALDVLLNPPPGRKPSLGELIRVTDDALRNAAPGDDSFHMRLLANPRYLVRGGSGTGKTVAAAWLAHRLAEHGRRTLLVCYNRPLADHLRDQLEPVAGLEVWNFLQLCYRRGLEAGFADLVDPDGPEADSRPQEYFRVDLPRILVRAMTDLPARERRFDSIVVDEGQDFSGEFWDALDSCHAADGERRLCVFFDPAQNIYGGVEPDTPAHDFLDENQRNTREICRVLAHVSGDGFTRPSRVRGKQPWWRVCERQDEPAQLVEVLDQLVEARAVPVEDVVVLTEKRSDRERLAPGGRVGPWEVTRDHRDRAGRLLLDTIWRFKGLESPVVVLVGLTARWRNPEDRLHVVGVGRARTHLVVICDQATRERLRPPDGRR